MTLLLGLDVGTSGIKALVLDPHSPDEAVSAAVDLPLATPRPGWTEQDPEDWWRATQQAIRLLIDQAGVDPARIEGVAASGQMHGATLLDAEGEVVRPCILWNDQRTALEAGWINETVGLDRLLEWVGNPALTGFTAPKLLWVRNAEPERYARVATILLPKDYINYRLTGERFTEVSDASGTLLFDVRHRRWSAEMLAALDVSPCLLPPARESTDTVGRVTAEAAHVTGLHAGTPVVAGGADNACAAVGAGVVRAGQVLASLGTSGTLVAPTEQPVVDRRGRLHTFCHAVPGRWYLMGVVLSAGGSLRWFRDTIAEPERILAQAQERDPYDVIMDEAALVPRGSEGLVFLPYLTGERTPHADPLARGAFVGLSLRHSRAHLARSVVEGVTYALADSADLMRSLGVSIASLRATGAGARSELWRSILANVLEARVLTTSGDTGPAFGAAILAGVGVGVFASIDAATDQLVNPDLEVVPEDKEATGYARLRAVYDALYPALKSQFGALSEIVGQEM
jgi:xylulokinase